MSRNGNVNIALGVIGSIFLTASALVAAHHHSTLSAVLLTIFANVWITRTIHLVRRLRRDRALRVGAEAESVSRQHDWPPPPRSEGYG